MKKICDHKNLENSIWVSRGKWICPDCKEDVSLLYVLLSEAAKEERKKVKSKVTNPLRKYHD